MLLPSTALKHPRSPIASVVRRAGCSTPSNSANPSAALRDRGIDRRARSASLYRMAPGWPHGDEQVTMLGTSQPQPPLPAEIPFDTTSSAHCAGDMLADALVEHGLPRHQLEADAVIDHGEAAARKLGRTDKRAADIFAGSWRR